ERAPVRVFYQVWSQPLMTLSDRHVVGEVIRLCGGRNVFGSLLPLVPRVSVEAVIAADPEIIVTAEADAQPSAAFELWRRYPKLRAVAADLLVTLDANRINRHGPRLLDEAQVLCERVDDARKSRAAAGVASPPTKP
ncbi:MAG TPA: cobalamin-binding protein, partial [Burkholderiaceae bacterium]|nr:cobalamin-binding protein [Burkholderiaceae bacterium]